jgi:uracil-DNA glycosylase
VSTPSRPAEELRAVAAEAAGCRACDLWEPATQTVFGAGPVDARIMLVGEQPGDSEDLEGAPFVGPAGRLLDDAIARAGLDREQVYLTNAVKHFKFAQRGKRRIHQKPNTTEVVACHRWIESELDIVRPGVVVLMGTVAVRSVLGRSATITSLRGTELTIGDADGVVTVHPSAILRSRSDRDSMMHGLIDDLRRAAEFATNR